MPGISLSRGEERLDPRKGLGAGPFLSPFSTAQVNKWYVGFKYSLYAFIPGDLIRPVVLM